MSPKKADFSRVKSGVRSTDRPAPKAKADFGDVRSAVSSSDRITGGAGVRTYTVVAGDTLSHIARAHYGKASRWKAIFEANRDQLDDPDRIFPGQVLKLPELDSDPGRKH